MPARQPNTRLPSATDIARLIEEAYLRREEHHDPDLHLWDDSPSGALVYLTTHKRVPHPVLVQDAQTALQLTRFLRAQLAVLELSALQVCRTPPAGQHLAPVTWGELTTALGVHTRQAAQQRHTRLHHAHAVQSPAHDPDDRARSWTFAHAGRVRTAAAALLRACPDIEATGNAEAIGWLEDIDSALDGYRGAHTQNAALLAIFRLLHAELHGGPGARIPAVRTAGDLAAEYVTARDGT